MATVELSRDEVASILAAIDHIRDTRPDMTPCAFEQYAQIETTLLVALVEQWADA